MLVLDAHVHCGITLPFERVASRWERAGIAGGVLIPPVEEVYDRGDPFFVDSEEYRKSRQQVHAYLASLSGRHLYPFWFVWNDFVLPPLGFWGVKWHRHPYEPQYRYAAPECRSFLEYVAEKGLPVLLEDEFHRTLELVDIIGGRTAVIIPHMGGLNGGYLALKEAGIFERPNVYADTALAYAGEIADFATDYGVERLIFGSDFPFGEPAQELAKVERLFTGRDRAKVLAENALKLISHKDF